MGILIITEILKGIIKLEKSGIMNFIAASSTHSCDTFHGIMVCM